MVNRESRKKSGTLQAHWQYNDETRGNSYWRAVLPPLDAGEELHYAIQGASGLMEQQTYQLIVAPAEDQAQSKQAEQGKQAALPVMLL
jgi:hypothetical protein